MERTGKIGPPFTTTLDVMYRGICRTISLLLLAAMSSVSVAETLANATLSDLKRQLDRIHSSRSEKPVGFEGTPPDLKPLSKLHRRQIHAALGNPGWCYNRNPGDRPASCLKARVWFYAFVKLPPNWAGGGLELVVVFDGDRVKYAVWEYSA